MPVLHHYQNRPGAYAKACINGAIVTFQLTAAGHQLLGQAGLTEGSTFPLNLLIDLLHRGEAFTRGDQTVQLATRHEAEQFCFDFDQDLRDERMLPTCEVTGQIDDLHLVVHGDPDSPTAQLLSPLARRPLTEITLSIPLALLDSKGLRLLRESEQIPATAPCLDTIRDWRDLNLADSWKAFVNSQRVRQQDLGLRSPDELEL